jgi:hypothetical protein
VSLRPLLYHFGVGLLDEDSEPSKRLAPPITQLVDSRIYQPKGESTPLPCFGPLFLFFTVAVALFMVVVARPSLEYRESALAG